MAFGRNEVDEKSRRAEQKKKNGRPYILVALRYLRNSVCMNMSCGLNNDGSGKNIFFHRGCAVRFGDGLIGEKLWREPCLLCFLVDGNCQVERKQSWVGWDR